ncbi:glycosyltransferase family 2 protein [Paracraurococcus ruber]|uniref:Glycosyltransferase 2-like domain-containing protein n=1 Tax=Paracraurococcus ruber TaxID=77675 RepID=A0ABS1CR58_9PROT|nr:glycosyltransferase family 2 protein [Paracraurococcus ruber]MBK1656925.1 hypothetical protein [Paracraurococcus ruber]TDG33284.1 glycosyltransferase family 2 protein [Paracraurococcus ruber]
MPEQRVTPTSITTPASAGRRTAMVTVCICTHGRPDYLRNCLDSLRWQTVDSESFEVVVVDSNSPAEAAAEIRRLVRGLSRAVLVRVDRPGLSHARNAGAAAARGDYIAYIDDDALAAPDWIERIQQAVGEGHRRPAVLSGRILPVWEAPLPGWWPASLRGVLSIEEWQGRGEYRTPAVPRHLEPYGVNFIVEREALLAVDGFEERLGRHAGLLLSDEEVHLAWRLQDRGRSVYYDSRIAVYHCIQAQRLSPAWLLQRLYWQAGSSVMTHRLLGRDRLVWRTMPRRLLLAILLRPMGVVPLASTRFLGLRWRLAYARGFVRMALGRGL